MKILLLATLLFISIFSASQNISFEKPDYNAIEKNIKNENSNLHYTKLMERFHNYDTTLTMEERRHLYYGYAFEPQYSPYGKSKFNDSIIDIVSKKEMNFQDYDRIDRYADSVLKDNPFDLRAMNYKLFAYDKLKDPVGFNNTLSKIKILFSAMLSSGTGISKKEALYVINVAHEYDLLNILGYTFAGSQRLVEHYDYLEVTDNGSGVKGLYFDISPSLNKLNQMFK